MHSLLRKVTKTSDFLNEKFPEMLETKIAFWN